MTTDPSTSYLQGLVRELRKLPRETEWVEFKANNDNIQEIGEYISALANAAALAGKSHGYVLWGVRDSDHTLVGTTFDPAGIRKGNEELESWLLRLLEPRIDFHFHTLDVDGQRVVLLEIAAAARHPVRFSGAEYIRVGSYKKLLKDFPEKERALWRFFDRVPFETGIAAEHLSAPDVLRLLDAPVFFDLLGQPLPDGHQRILESLAANGLVTPSPAGGWNITNLGAILLAHRLRDFGSLGRKVPEARPASGGDEHLHPRAIRDRGTKPCHGFSPLARRRRSRGNRIPRRHRSAQAHAVPALVGWQHAAGGVMRALLDGYLILPLPAGVDTPSACACKALITHLSLLDGHVNPGLIEVSKMTGESRIKGHFSGVAPFDGHLIASLGDDGLLGAVLG